jgi:hypothetical protein
MDFLLGIGLILEPLFFAEAQWDPVIKPTILPVFYSGTPLYNAFQMMELSLGVVE